MSARKTKSFFQRVETPEGEAFVHVNRRGCKGRWTKKDDAALHALVEAVQKMHREGKIPPVASAAQHGSRE